jgi:hypothetical protein
LRIYFEESAAREDEEFVREQLLALRAKAWPVYAAAIDKRSGRFLI